EARVGRLAVIAGIAVEPDLRQADRHPAIGPDPVPRAVAPARSGEGDRALADSHRDIDREFLLALFAGAATAAALAALAAGRTGEAQEFEQVYRHPLGAVADRHRATSLAGVVAERADLRVVEGIDEGGRPAALAGIGNLSHR